jgi:hypothetical protein
VKEEINNVPDYLSRSFLTSNDQGTEIQPFPPDKSYIKSKQQNNLAEKELLRKKTINDQTDNDLIKT